MPSTVDQWTIIVGVMLPLVIAAINRTVWDSASKAISSVVLCVIAAGGELLFKGQLSVTTLLPNAITIFFLVVTTYKGFWKPTGVTDAIEKKTG